MGATVYVDISCWYGYSVGARHYYVKIYGWKTIGGVYRSKFDTYEQAAAYAREIVDTHFVDCEIESTGVDRFVYDRVGD